MLKLILILFLGGIRLTKSNECVAMYGQCGGLQYTGITQCCSSSTCQTINAWYYQCLPSSTSVPTGCNAVWSQCGGQNWSGPTCCDNSICTYSNPYYSQCLPPSAASTSTTSTTTQSSSSTSSTTTSTTTTTTTTSSTTTSTTTSSSTASSNQGCSTLWGQCDGIGWNGPKSCCTGSTCTFSNPHYSQCLPSGTSSTASSSTVASSTTTIATTTQSGVTTRYWDCCKASCGWPGKATVSNPVQTCAQDGVTVVDSNIQSGCNGGSAYMCNNQQPWNVSATLSYGFAAAVLTGQNEASWCCACYSLIFTSGPVAGKEMIVQVTNTGGDLGNNHFDLQMPGGGVGYFTQGCSSQFPGSYSWGAQYGGVSERSGCANLPSVLQSGCYWRFDWFQNADNPSISFTQVTCPSVLTDKTQCIRP